MAIPFCDPLRCPAAGCAPVTCAGLGLASNDALFERSQRVIPGGVNSPVRAFRSVGGTPYFVARAEGPYVWDVEGARYIDLVQSYGAIIARPRPPAGRRRDHRGRRRRHVLRRADGARGAAGRGDPRAGAELRAGAHGQQRHRGHHDRVCAWPAASPGARRS